MSKHALGPRDYANGVPEPAKIDTHFAAVQAAVYAKAGLIVPAMDYSSLDHQPVPKPVQIRMNNNGAVLSVHHEVAIQKVHQGIATLV